MRIATENIVLGEFEHHIIKGNIESTSGCFRTLSIDELGFINSKKTQVTYHKGETVFKQGAFAPHVLYVNSGLVRVYLQAGTNKQINIRLAKQGDFMAFSTVFGEEIYTHSAVALKDSNVCMIEKEALKKLMFDNPEFAIKINTLNSANEARCLEIIGNISYKQMRGKLASAILYLTHNKFANEKVFEYLTRQDIADFASITVESAIKFLKEFEKEGVITLGKKNVGVVDLARLEEINRVG